MKFKSEDLMKAMGLQVGDRIKYGDISFCIKSQKECKLKKCFRHICHNSNPLHITVADYEGSECCLKKEVKKDE